MAISLEEKLQKVLEKKDKILKEERAIRNQIKERDDKIHEANLKEMDKVLSSMGIRNAKELKEALKQHTS